MQVPSVYRVSKNAPQVYPTHNQPPFADQALAGENGLISAFEEHDAPSGGRIFWRGAASSPDTFVCVGAAHNAETVSVVSAPVAFADATSPAMAIFMGLP